MVSIQSGKIARHPGFLLPEKYGILFDRQTFPLKHLSWQKKLSYVIQGIRSGLNPWNRFRGIPPVLQIEPVVTAISAAGPARWSQPHPQAARSHALRPLQVDHRPGRRQVSLMAFWATRVNRLPMKRPAT